ncbi:MAG: ATP-binding protein [Ignavibacteriales bacterium]|nr:ATP-binding protein [Ignavibacteriales bacterium]
MAMNEWQCGFYTDPFKECTCSQQIIQKYMSRISGPLLDRIDIHIEVLPVKYKELSSEAGGEISSDIRYRVQEARTTQIDRFKSYDYIYKNADMRSAEMCKYSQLDTAGSEALKMAMAKLGLSARAYDRILKVSRTIADLERSLSILAHHVSEAVQYSSLDLELWKH